MLHILESMLEDDLMYSMVFLLNLCDILYIYIYIYIKDYVLRD